MDAKRLAMPFAQVFCRERKQREKEERKREAGRGEERERASEKERCTCAKIESHVLKCMLIDKPGTSKPLQT